MAIFPLRRGTYFAMFFVCLVCELLLTFVTRMVFGTDWYSHDGMKLAFITLVWLAALTYPLGMVPTLLSWIVTISLGWMTPFGSVLFLLPLYAVAGYFQWYVLVPKYVGRRNVAPISVRGEPVEP